MSFIPEVIPNFEIKKVFPNL